MKHYLITRFNLPSVSWKRTARGERTLTKEWHQHRYKLFQDFCLPAVLNQTNKNFTWLMFFDENTKGEFRTINSNFEKRYKNLEIFYVDQMSSLLGKIKERISKETPNPNEFIITTRLDNDDIIHKDFIESIQLNVVPKSKTMIDLRAGYQVVLNNDKIRIREYDLAFNSFISLVEQANDCETVLSKKHMQWQNHPNIIVYEQKRLWGSLIHGKNILNTEIRKLQAVDNFRFENFGISEEALFLTKTIENPHVFNLIQKLKANFGRIKRFFTKQN